MKKILYISFLTCLLLSLGCSSKSDEGGGSSSSIKITSGTTATIGEDGGEVSISFTTTDTWKATVGANATNWCSLNTKSGVAGSTTIVATTKKNTSYEERNASITITCGTSKATVTITQKQNNAILISSDKVEKDYNGGAFEIEVISNVNYTYTIISGGEWIKETTGSKALTKKTVYFNVDENWEETAREGEIKFTDGTIVENVKVYQQAGTKRIVISQKEYNLKSDDTEIKVELRTNCDYTLKMPEVTWIKEVASKAFSSYTHYFEVEKNESYDNRSATIEFINNEDGSIENVEVNQSQVNAIILGKNEYSVSYESDTLNLTVNTNVEFNIDIDVDWIEDITSATKALEDVPLSLKISKNPTSQKRVGKVTLSYDEIEQVITITQEGSKETMSFSYSLSGQKTVVPTIYGESVSGNIDWGDETSEIYSDKATHIYKDAGEKDVTVNAINVEGVIFESLKSIDYIEFNVVM